MNNFMQINEFRRCHGYHLHKAQLRAQFLRSRHTGLVRNTSFREQSFIANSFSWQLEAVREICQRHGYAQEMPSFFSHTDA